MQKFRKKLFYFREEQEIQFASLEVESDGFGGGLPYKRDGGYLSFLASECKCQINLGTDRSILKDVCPGEAPIKSDVDSPDPRKIKILKTSRDQPGLRDHDRLLSDLS